MTTTMIKVADVETPLNIPTPKDLFDMTGVSKAWPEPKGWTPTAPVWVPDGGTKVMDEWVSERAGNGARWPYPDMTEHHARVDQIMSVLGQPFEAESTFVTEPSLDALSAETPYLDALEAGQEWSPVRAWERPAELRFPDGFEATWMPEGTDNPAVARLLGIAYCKAAWELAAEEFNEPTPDTVILLPEPERPSFWGRVKEAWRVLRHG